MAFAIPHELHGTPGWQLDSDRRLRVSMLLAAIIVVALLSALRFPVAGSPLPLTEIVVRLIERATEAVAEQTVVEDQEEETPPVTGEQEPASTPAAPAEVSPVPLEATDRVAGLFPPFEIQIIEDWHEFGAEVIREFVANLHKPVSVNPVFDEKRRQAAIRFRPSAAPVELHPWDKVEKDQIGRTILQLGGGCSRVLDDPSAVYRDIFETYTQYIVECAITFGKRKPQELPWVADVRARYAYLRRWEEQKRDPNAF